MIPLILFLLAIAAVYIGAIEAAFSALMRLSLRLMVERGGRDDQLGFYLDDPIRLFLPARLLLGLIFSFATICIALLTGRTGFGSIGMLLLFVAIFIVVCEHVVPIFIVRRNPERMLEFLLPPFDVLARIVKPLTNSLTRLIVEPRRERVEVPDPATAAVAPVDPALGAPVDGQAEEERLDVENRKLLQSIVDFGDTLVREVMTPRPDMVAISADATMAELRAFFLEQEYSRIPVYGENLDNILGMIYVKDLIRLRDVPDQTGVRDVPQLFRAAAFVPETKRVADLMKEFQRRQVQIAIVVDEYGGTAGLATLEDLLEEIVGEIRDEYDVEVDPVTAEPDGAFAFSGRVSFDEVRERLGVEVEPEGFETVGGYVLTRVGRVPAVGERFELDGMEVEVLEAERRRIHRVRFRKVQPVEAEKEGR